MPSSKIYTISLHDALQLSVDTTVRTPATDSASCCAGAARRTYTVTSSPDCAAAIVRGNTQRAPSAVIGSSVRSEEHTSELQSHSDLVCRRLLEKKKLR